MSSPISLAGSGEFTAAGAVVAPQIRGVERQVQLRFSNTSGTGAQLVTLTVTHDGGTARRVGRHLLLPHECVITPAVTLGGGDALSAQTSDDSVVDYLLYAVTPPGPDGLGGACLESGVFDATGARKSVTPALATSTTTPGASTAAAGSLYSDAGALPAATSSVYPTTGADDTKGVIISTSDQVTGRTILIGNGVSNKVLKIYAPAGGVINGAAANAAFSSASGKGVIITCTSGPNNTWAAS